MVQLRNTARLGACSDLFKHTQKASWWRCVVVGRTLSQRQPGLCRTQQRRSPPAGRGHVLNIQSPHPSCMQRSASREEWPPKHHQKNVMMNKDERECIRSEYGCMRNEHELPRRSGTSYARENDIQRYIHEFLMLHSYARKHTYTQTHNRNHKLTPTHTHTHAHTHTTHDPHKDENQRAATSELPMLCTTRS